MNACIPSVAGGCSERIMGTLCIEPVCAANGDANSEADSDEDTDNL